MSPEDLRLILRLISPVGGALPPIEDYIAPKRNQGPRSVLVGDKETQMNDHQAMMDTFAAKERARKDQEAMMMQALIRSVYPAMGATMQARDDSLMPGPGL